jgi:hypothetical protein
VRPTDKNSRTEHTLTSSLASVRLTQLALEPACRTVPHYRSSPVITKHCFAATSQGSHRPVRETSPATPPPDNVTQIKCLVPVINTTLDGWRGRVELLPGGCYVCPYKGIISPPPPGCATIMLPSAVRPLVPEAADTTQHSFRCQLLAQTE